MIKMVQGWKINAWLLRVILEDFAGEEWWERPQGVNNAVWLLGHILGSRKHVARELGLELGTEDRDRLFDMGTKPEDLPNDLDGAAMLAEYADVHEKFLEYIEELDEATLDEPVENQYPEMPQTRLGALQFMFLHECYHVGQLGYLRVALGKGSWMSKM